MKYLTVIASLLAALGGFAQTDQGVIIFEHKINLHARLSEENAQMKAMIPEWQEWKMQLSFRPDASLYSGYEDAEEDLNMEGNGMRIMIRRPESIFYHHFGEQRSLESREFMQKRYLITQNTPKTPWKMTGETKEILGYTCYRALTTSPEDSSEVEVWYTDAIPVPAGPTTYGNLPGMILEVSSAGGAQLIRAVKINPGEVRDKDLAPPTKGKEISRADFDKMVKEEMEKMGGQGGMRIMRF